MSLVITETAHGALKEHTSLGLGAQSLAHGEAQGAIAVF